MLAAVGGPETVRGGALADLVARIEAAGHAVETRELAVAPRPATAAALLRYYAARRGAKSSAPTRSSSSAAARQTASASMLSVTDCS